MLGSAPPVAFLPSGDLDRSRRFYESTLQLRCIEQDEYAVVFAMSGTALRVTRVATPPALPFTVFGWVVADIGVTIDGLRAAGVSFARFPGMEQDEHDVWHAPGGALVAWFLDPDANLLSLTQSPSA
jgi:catechol 2,3-dioxygenase-like lactoylglutathione lyase family enzyme